jgi:OmpA family
MKYKKNALSKLLMMVTGAFVISVSAQQLTTQRVGTVVDPKGDAYEKLSIISPPLTRLIIYRLQDNKSQNAAGIEINGHYHTSLQAGNAISNQRLSESRAKTIHDYFIAAGVNSNKLSSEGRGSDSLVVSHCARKATVQSIACNQPNRRVVVNVSTLTQ